MLTTTTHRRGRALCAFRTSILMLLALLTLGFAGTAVAASTLKNVTYQTLPGGRVQAVSLLRSEGRKLHVGLCHFVAPVRRAGR